MFQLLTSATFKEYAKNSDIYGGGWGSIAQWFACLLPTANVAGSIAGIPIIIKAAKVNL